MPTLTRPLEEAIRRVPGILLVRSITSRGSVEISAEFEWGTDMQVALQRVQAETQRVKPDLPADTRIDVEWMNTATFPILGYALTSDTVSQAQLWDQAQYSLKPALLSVPGISEVQIQGGRQREFEVRLDPGALQGRGLSAADVVDAIRTNNDVLSAGLVEQNHELYLALVNGRVHSLDALGNISVPTPSGPPATLAQLGTLQVANEVSYIRTTDDGKPAVLINIVRQPSANTLKIADGITELLKTRPELVPRGARWSTFYDQARFVRNSVNGTRDAIIIGVALAAVILLLFLGQLRLALIAVAAIPLTVAIVGLALGAASQSVNLMTLAGVAAALGLIADDSIVVIEDIEHRRSLREPDPADAALRRLLPALIGSSLSTTIILLPFSLLPGIAGAFFKPLAFTMALALIVSFFIATFVVPTAVARFGWRHKAVKEKPNAGTPSLIESSTAPARRGRVRRLFDGARAMYDSVLRAFIQRSWLAPVVLVVLLGTGWLLYRRIGTDFLPDMDEGSIILDYWTPPGTSLTDTDEMLRRMEQVILAMPDVSSYSRRTGTQLGFFITEPNRGDYVINLKPRGQRRPVDEVIDDLRSSLDRLEPAVHTDFGQILEDNIGDLTGGEPQPIDVKIFGDDPGVLAADAKRVADVMSKVPGIEDVFNGITIAGPALDVHVDPVAAARYGLTTEQIHAQIEPAILGTVVDQVRIGDRMYDLRVLEGDSTGLSDVPIRARNALIPLRALASISTGQPEAEIDRDNLKTYIGVTARLSGRDLGGAVADIKNAIAREVPLGPGVTIEYGGLYQQQQNSFRDLLFVLLGGLALVGLVVLFEFGDWRAPVVTALCAAAVLPGVLAALMLTGMTLNISSYVGAIMMVGIVGENAIFVIHEGHDGLLTGLAPADAWSRASWRRLRPVAMTVLATAFALAPLALALGEGAQLMQPLAVAVIGGFTLSGPIVLFLLPGLYRLLDPSGQLGRTHGFEDMEEAT
jgi:CzcA family heavy metal efflux pump